MGSVDVPQRVGEARRRRSSNDELRLSDPPACALPLMIPESQIS